jgi:UPF0755 protein
VALTRRGKIAVALGSILAAAVVIAVGGALWLRSMGVWGSSHPGHTVSVVIPKGASASHVGRILADRGVIESALGFRIRLFLDGDTPPIEAGRYELRTGLTVSDAIAALTGRGPIVDYVSVTFPEGSTLKQFAAIVGRETKIPRKRFLEVATAGRIRSAYEPDGVGTLEGLVFPSTYQVVGKDTAGTLVQRLVDTFDQTFSSLDTSEIRAMGYTPYQAIIVASMVEEEAKVDEDRGKIARVIYNRLGRGMPLGIDATIEYALGKHANELTRSDLRIDSPYNTRTHAGLPPTPIAAAGKASLEAALHPAPGRWLYYVLRDCSGHHAFSTSYDRFLSDKARYQSLSC